MALVYFDPSALVKLVVEKSGSDLVAELWDGCDAARSSRLAYPEMRAVLASAGRNHYFDAGGLADALTAWEELWAATRPVELNAHVERRAGGLTARHALRGADVVHLASALAVGDADLVVAVGSSTTRRRDRRAARRGPCHPRAVTAHRVRCLASLRQSAIAVSPRRAQ